jgi:hypothetical protein
MARTAVARVALGAAMLLGTAAVAGIAWAAQYPYDDITETFVKMLSAMGTVAALAAFGVFWHYRR